MTKVVVSSMAFEVIELVSPKTVNLNAGLAATPPGLPASLTYQRPKNVCPIKLGLPGINRLAEPNPLPAPLPDKVRLSRANDAVAGIDGPAPGSLLSMTSTA